MSEIMDHKFMERRVRHMTQKFISCLLETDDKEGFLDERQQEILVDEMKYRNPPLVIRDLPEIDDPEAQLLTLPKNLIK